MNAKLILSKGKNVREEKKEKKKGEKKCIFMGRKLQKPIANPKNANKKHPDMNANNKQLIKNANNNHPNNKHPAESEEAELSPDL